MKKVVLFSILGIILFGEVTFAAVTLARNPSPTDVWIKFVLIFHKPRTQCTSGFGICFDVLFGGDLIDAPMGAKGCPVRGQINNLNELVVEIAESDLNSYENGSTIPYFKNQNTITIPEAYTISQTTCRSLGLGGRFTIKEGSYPVTFKEGVYRVVFHP